MPKIKRTLNVLVVNGIVRTESVICDACLSDNNKDFEQLNYTGQMTWRKFDADSRPELNCKHCGYPIEERNEEEKGKADSSITWA